MSGNGPTKYKYRIYISFVRRIGTEVGLYLPEEYDKAERHFDTLVANGYECVYLQELDPDWGWVSRTLKVHKSDDFDDRTADYWERRKVAESEWRPGDALWNAPGMSIHDFI